MPLKHSTQQLQNAIGLKKKLMSEGMGPSPKKRATLAANLRAKRKEFGRKGAVKKLINNAHYDQSKVHKMRHGHFPSRENGMRM